MARVVLGAAPPPPTIWVCCTTACSPSACVEPPFAPPPPPPPHATRPSASAAQASGAMRRRVMRPPPSSASSPRMKSRQERKIKEGAGPFLEEGEEVLAAIVARPRGWGQAMAGSFHLGEREERAGYAAAEEAGFGIH